MGKILTLMAWLLPLILLTGCETPRPYDYTAFKKSRPRSLLVLPPVNDTNHAGATYSLFAQMTYPLAESGYYVLPVTLVDDTLKRKGLSHAADIHALPPAQLRGLFGADAALYVTISQYGNDYTVLDSVTTVAARARLVDLKTGAVLWRGKASASNNEDGSDSGGGLAGALVTAAIKQVIHELTDTEHEMAGIASARLLGAGQENGILYGPRSPNFGKD
ncbi:DUF799 domain-containing protein [Paludibacterium paludis]|uniref:Lipoprotein n=1 Tax=Paludibacterium paludis TaxID=1225769 RepID=A0A918NWJ9_9NEIS|nr:DUF799 domain-containing protein [Paludibacterium paludis]GGY02728.1 lipoprotein [Paludibacterium paludis]